MSRAFEIYISLTTNVETRNSRVNGINYGYAAYETNN